MINTKLAVLRSKPTEISAEPNVQLQFQDNPPYVQLQFQDNAPYVQLQFGAPSRATTPSDPDQATIEIENAPLNPLSGSSLSATVDSQLQDAKPQFQNDAAYVQHNFGAPSRATTPSDPDQATIIENTKPDDRSSLPSLTHSPLSAFNSVINIRNPQETPSEIQLAPSSPIQSSTHTPESGEVENQLNNQLVPSPRKKPLGLGEPDSLNNSFMEVKEKIPKTNSTPYYALLGLTIVGSAAASAGFFLGGLFGPAWAAVMTTSVSSIAGAYIGVAKYKEYKERARAIRDSNPAGNNRGKGKSSKSPKKDVEMGNLGNSDLGIREDASVLSGKSREHRLIKNGEDVNAEPNPGFEEASTLVSQPPQARFGRIQDPQTSPIDFDSILPASAPGLKKLSGKESPNNIALAAGQSKTGKDL